MRVRLVNTQCIVDDGMYDLYDIAFAQARIPEGNARFRTCLRQCR